MNALDVLAHGFVDGLAMADVGDVHDNFHEMLHRPAGFLDQLFDVLHDLMRLRDGIMAVDICSIGQTLRALAAQPDRLAAGGDDRLAKVIIEVLLRIRIPRVELADANVGHGGGLRGFG